MADFTPIAFGSNGWDKKINEALIQIFAGGGSLIVVGSRVQR